MVGNKKRGRKARYASYNGREIEGLYVQFNKDKSVRAYYYLDQNKRQITCTSDITEAVRRFKKYKNEIDYIEVFGQPKNLDLDNLKDGFKRDTKFEVIIDNGIATIQTIDQYPKQLIVNRFVELLKENPFEISLLSGIPQLAHLENVIPLPKSLTVKELGDNFKNRTDINHNYKKDVKNYWAEFANIVKKQEIRQITYDDITTYNDTIHSQSKEKIKDNKITNPQVWINNRFNAVKAVIDYSYKKTEYKTDLNKLLEHLKQLSFITKYKKKKPKVLTKNEFQALSNNAKDKITKCLLYLGLNCGMRYEDIKHLKKSEIEYTDKYLQRPRTKTGIIHSAILWNETITTLKEYMAENPNNSEYVFITNFGNQYKEKYLRAYFDKARTDRSITHKHLRNSVISIANRYNCNPNGIDILRGHNISGVDNSYNERHPEATRDICQKVYDFYFKQEQ